MRLLLVEDDFKLGALLQRVLQAHDYVVTLCRSVAAARKCELSGAGIAVVDWMLPDGDGLEVCRLLRRTSFEGPILMLTARSDTNDKVQALDLGADDYLTKPFELEELLARLRALTRRSGAMLTLDAGPIHLDLGKGYAFCDGKLLALSTREYELLRYLVRHPNQTLSKGELAEQVWEAGEEAFNTVEVTVSRLRDKLADAASVLETIRGQGYRLRGSS